MADTLYAEYIMEFMRVRRGLKPGDKSQDEEIVKDLSSGVKMSKSMARREHIQRGRGFFK